MLEKSTEPNMPMIGMMMSPTRDSTILPKAAPMITPMARSMTLPFMANSLNSLNIFALLVPEAADRRTSMAPAAEHRQTLCQPLAADAQQRRHHRHRGDGRQQD